MKYTALVLIACVILAGCGGGGGNTATTGRATFTVLWPEPSRLIPAASQSIRVEMRRNNVLVDTKVIARPVGGGTATATFQNLPLGEVTATATAHPQTDGTGTVQAEASIAITIRAGETTNFLLTMASTITKVEVSPSNPVVCTGATIQLTATARNQNDQVVLITPGTLEWSSSNQTVATVSSTGLVAYVGNGTAEIKVKEKESAHEGAVTLASGLPRYTLTNLGIIPDEASGNTIARDLNEQGIIVGSANSSAVGGVVGFVWSAGSPTTFLPPLGPSPNLGNGASAVGVNDPGKVVGHTTTVNGLFGYVWSPATGMLQLPELGPAHNGRIVSQAYAINNEGLIVGYSSTPEGDRAVLWEGGQPLNLGIVGIYVWQGSLRFSSARNINELGQVVGTTTAPGGYLAFLWDRTTGMKTLGAFGPDRTGRVESYSEAVNERGQVVGWSTGFAPDSNHAFIWTESQGMRDLGVLGAGSQGQRESRAADINNAGQVIGSTTLPGGGGPFLWTESCGMVELQTLVTGAPGWSLGEVLAINDRGQIVGYGQFNGRARAFLLTPQP